MNAIGTSDFFAVGTGFDITGAVLLALGLLASPQLLLARGQSAIGFNSEVIIEACRDRARGIVGVLGLATGFGLQLLGYLASLENEPRGSGWRAVIVALLLAAAAVATALGAAKVYVEPEVRRLLVSVACLYRDGERAEGDEARADVTFLANSAKRLGEAQRDGETGLAYLGRVFPLEGRELNEPDPRVLEGLVSRGVLRWDSLPSA